MAFPWGQKSNFHFKVKVKGINDDQLPLNSSNFSSREIFQAGQVDSSNLKHCQWMSLTCANASRVSGLCHACVGKRKEVPYSKCTWSADIRTQQRRRSHRRKRFGWEDQIIKKKFWRMQMGKKGIPGQGNPGAKLQIMSSSEHSSAFFEQQVVHSDLLAR